MPIEAPSTHRAISTTKSFSRTYRLELDFPTTVWNVRLYMQVECERETEEETFLHGSCLLGNLVKPEVVVTLSLYQELDDADRTDRKINVTVYC